MKFVDRLRYIPMIMQAYADAQTESRLQREHGVMRSLPVSASSHVDSEAKVGSRRASHLHKTGAKVARMTKARGVRGHRLNPAAPGRNNMHQLNPATVAQLVRELRQTREQLRELRMMRSQVHALQQQLQHVRTREGDAVTASAPEHLASPVTSSEPDVQS